MHPELTILPPGALTILPPGAKPTIHEPPKLHIARIELLLLPPREGSCQFCGRTHDPAIPHDALSIHYQIWFIMKYGRKPTWYDAVDHCTRETRDPRAHHLGCDDRVHHVCELDTTAASGCMGCPLG
jgi:hypothetical protein